MTVKVIANAASARVGGGLSYILRQLAALEQVRPDIELRVLAAPWNLEALRSGLSAPVEVLPVPNAGRRYLHEQLVLPRQVGEHELLYCPGNFGPLGPRRPPVVVTLQNPNYVGRGPAFVANRGLNRRGKIALSRLSLRRADRVVVISESLADEVRSDLPGVASRMTVITSGAPKWPTPEQAPAGFPVEGGHLLSLANDYPHKHLDHLVEAWARAFAERDGPALALVGDVSAARREAQTALVPRSLRPRLLHLGAVADRGEVRWLLAHAWAMVAPSALEAFPLTPAEAGSVGCPVVLSDIAPHREVAGPHGRFVSVGDITALAAALAAVVDRPPERSTWRFERSWEDNARDLGAVFDDVLQARSRS